MSADGSAAERAVVTKLARGSLFSRLKGGKQPLKLVAVPRDHVHGDRQLGESLLAGRFALGSETISLKNLDFAQLGASPQLKEKLEGFSWLRDLAAAAAREKGARLAEAVVGRWLLAHGTKVDEAWAPHLWGERILFWAAYAPYILSSTDSGYRSALLNTLARGARHLDGSSDRASAGLDRVTAWCGVVAAVARRDSLERLRRPSSTTAALSVARHSHRYSWLTGWVCFVPATRRPSRQFPTRSTRPPKPR
jgi:uncharacterized heparinase superfamily protein